MDKSKEYIAMCEKATEIQEQRPHLIGDFRFDTVLEKIQVLQENSDMDDQETFIWLPRQDQLYALVKNVEWFEVMFRFYDWLSDRLDSVKWFSRGCAGVDSKEQLLLTFVMDEEYNKTWNGKDWEE